MIKSFKYLTPFVLYVLTLSAFNGNGLICWLPLLYTFFLIPFVELFIKSDPSNLDEVEEALAKKLQEMLGNIVSNSDGDVKVALADERTVEKNVIFNYVYKNSRKLRLFFFNIH